jgi:hypothetical protein
MAAIDLGAILRPNPRSKSQISPRQRTSARWHPRWPLMASDDVHKLQCTIHVQYLGMHSCGAPPKTVLLQRHTPYERAFPLSRTFETPMR